MRLDPFLLDRWLQEHAGPSIPHDFGGSTGPTWTLREVLALDGLEESMNALLNLPLAYSRTEGDDALRAAIADMAGVPFEQVIVLTGAAEALTHTFLLAAQPGANVVVPFPCFPPHEVVPRAFGLEVRSYELRRETRFRVDLDAVGHLVDANTRVLLVNVPHNPTGAVLADAELMALHDLAAQRGVTFVCDEVHSPVFAGPATRSAAGLPHATVIGDMSKAFSLPGLRLGWVIEPDARRRRDYGNAREYLTISNSPVTELLAEIAVRHHEVVRGRSQEVAQRNLQPLDALFAAHAGVVDWVRPRGGMTGFPWLTDGGDARDLCAAAARAGILLVPGDCFRAPEHFRIGFGSQAAGFEESVGALSAFLGSR